MANKFDKAVNLRFDTSDLQETPAAQPPIPFPSKKSTKSNDSKEKSMAGESKVPESKPAAIEVKEQPAEENKIAEKYVEQQKVEEKMPETEQPKTEQFIYEQPIKEQAADTPTETVETEQVQHTEKIIINKVINSKETSLDFYNGTLDIDNFTSFEQLHTAFINHLDKIIALENTSTFGINAKKAKKIRFSDRYKPAMISIRPIILEYIEKVTDNSTLTKAEVIDKLLINGIRVTKF